MSDAVLISDQPTIEDQLGRAGFVKAVAAQIAACTPPQSFGIHGDWGSGKTSFLRQLRYHLSGEAEGAIGTPPAILAKAAHDKRVLTVWFEAWRYQNEPVPVVALLHEMRRQFGVMAKLKAGTKKTVSVSVRSLLNSFNDVGKLIGLEASPINADKIEAVGERWERDHLEQTLFTDTVHSFLSEALGALLRELKLNVADAPRLVIIIDDLDRCNPEAAYRLLEGLKIYLNLPNCVFVLGMNQQVVIDAIASNLTKGEILPQTRVRAEAYLEKLCANIWRLPLVEDSQVLLKGWVHDPDLGQQLIQDLSDKQGKPLRCLPPNPRRLKALANLINRYWSKLPEATKASLASSSTPSTASLAQRLLIVTYIYQFHSEIYQRWQHEPDFYAAILRWVRGQFTPGQWMEGKFIPGSTPEYFERLTLPISVSSDPSTSTPTPVQTSTYPDPTAAEVFWVAPLIAHLGDNARPQDFVDLLRLTPTP